MAPRTAPRGRPRLYDWAHVPFPSDAAPGWRKGPLGRRSITEPDDLVFYLTHAPARTTPADLVRVAGTRWTIEIGFEAAKSEVGLDDYEVRSWTGWHRHVTLAVLAHAYLAVLRKAVAEAASGGRGQPRRSRHRPATRHRAGSPPSALASRLDRATQSRHGPGLVALAQTPSAARPPPPLAHTGATP